MKPNNFFKGCHHKGKDLLFVIFQHTFEKFIIPFSLETGIKLRTLKSTWCLIQYEASDFEEHLQPTGEIIVGMAIYEHGPCEVPKCSVY